METLGQREGRFVFYVLHAHVLRTSYEDSQGIGKPWIRVLGPWPLCSGPVQNLPGIRMVEHTLRLIVRRGGAETRPVLSGLHRRGVLPWREAHLHKTACGPLRIAGAQDEASFKIVVVKSLPFPEPALAGDLPSRQGSI